MSMNTKSKALIFSLAATAGKGRWWLAGPVIPAVHSSMAQFVLSESVYFLLAVTVSYAVQPEMKDYSVCVVPGM
jgi:hypothetical protein